MILLLFAALNDFGAVFSRRPGSAQVLRIAGLRVLLAFPQLALWLPALLRD